VKVQITGFFLLLFIVISCNRFGESKSDVHPEDTLLVNKMISYIEHHLNEQSDSLMIMIDSAANHAERTGYKKGMNWAEFYKACILYKNNEVLPARKLFYKVHEASEKSNDLKLKAHCLERLGSIHLGTDDRNLAIRYYFESLALSEKLKDSIHLARIYNVLGFYKGETTSLDSGIFYLNKALEINKRSGDDYAVTQNMGNMGYLYEMNGQFDRADSIYHVLVNNLVVVGDKMSLPVIYYNLASLHQKNNRNDSAIIYLHKAIGICEQNHDTAMLSVLRGNLGEIFLNMRQIDSARYCLNQAVFFAKALDDVETALQAYHFLNKLDSVSGQYGKVVARFSDIMALKDTIHNRAIRNNLRETELRYENEKKNGQIEAQEMAIRNHSRERNLMIAILLVSSVAAFVLIWAVILQRRNFRKNKQLLENTLLVEKLKSDQLLQKEEINNLRLEKFRKDLNEKENELISIALGIEQKNELLEQISHTLMESGISENDKVPVKQILSTIKTQLSDNREADLFNQQFSALHKEFFTNLQLAHPDLTKNELKFCAYLRVQLSSSQIAHIMNVTSEAIRKTRYRIRKKLNLPVDASLENYIMKF
jgi:tetratricopeptide (TPR) repeat protein/DNA-binding CsgD family transcriptional regulator